MKKILLASAAVALALGVSAGSASANGFSWKGYGEDDDLSVKTKVVENHDFSNEVNTDWDWYHDTKSFTDIDAYVDFDIENLQNLTQVSNVQKLFGDVKAETSIDLTVDGKAGGDKYGHGYGGNTAADAEDALAVAVGSATAVGNMFSLSSSLPSLLLTSDQIQGPVTVADAYPEKSVDVEAVATAVTNNTAVQLNATAVSNMLSINMSEPTVVTASLMQTSYADVSAYASSEQNISGVKDYSTFNNLSPTNLDGGVLVKPPAMDAVVANVAATAVGNMTSINLGKYASIPTGANTSFDQAH